MNVKQVIIGVLVIPLGLYWLVRHMGRKNRWGAAAVSDCSGKTSIWRAKLSM